MYIGDLHIHSRYSRATSKDGTPEHLDMWARKKGIHIIGTGDFTHPAWREELKEKLTPAEDGLYRLKPEYRMENEVGSSGKEPHFVVSGEISSIYKKNGKVRKVHSLLLLPGLEDGEKLSKKLETIGNIHSDGRPILGLDCRDLLEIMMEICPQGIYIPAHIWTPHFSMFGAFSGFDTIEECFGDMTPYVHALETGLSSDPPMNWRLSALDGYQLVSNSDAHSPSKLGREANLFHMEMSYGGLKKAVETGEGLAGTIEFFPEEGKYHYDGHRKCHMCLSPSQTEKYSGKCPVCGGKITIGVEHRVEQLADREEGYRKPGAKPYESLVPLPEVIASSTGRSAAGNAVQEQYESMIQQLGPEFEILREIPVEDIKKNAGSLVSEGIRRLRAGEVKRIPGFDGEYGTIKLFEPGEIDNLEGQMSLFSGFGLSLEEKRTEAPRENMQEESIFKGKNIFVEQNLREEKEQSQGKTIKEESKEGTGQGTQREDGLNEAQREAVQDVSRVTAVIAGPGTGKTRTLTSKVLWLLENRKVKPSEITAVTFTNKAAQEMEERLTHKLGARNARKINIGTFHSICFKLLRERMEISLADEMEAEEIGEEIIEEFQLKETAGQFLNQVSRWKNGKALRDEMGSEGEKAAKEKGTESAEASEREEVEKIEAAFFAYDIKLRERGLFDFDDLLLECLRDQNEVNEKAFSYLLVDEFQDVSPVQYLLMRKWNKKGRELFVIGDPDQAIYGFRGADDKCFDRLKEDYEGVREIRLRENYRSSGNIVACAKGMIEKNPGGERRICAVKEEGLPVRVVEAQGERAEAIFIAKEINRLVGGMDMIDTETQANKKKQPGYERAGVSFNDIAVLYRTHRQAALLEMCLKKEGIPYVVVGREEFLQEKKVKGTICFFRSLLDERDGFARKTALKLLWNLEEDQLSGGVYEAMAAKYAKGIKKEKPQKILEAWAKDLALEEDEGMEKLISTAIFHKNMEDFLHQLAFGKERDLKRCGGKVYKADSVTLMTMHGSKGLEFPTVIIHGTRKGMVPLESSKGKTDENEERRLFYVGMTRAEEELIIAYGGEPSPFLEDIPEKGKIMEQAHKRKGTEKAVQMSLFDFCM